MVLIIRSMEHFYFLENEFEGNGSQYFRESEITQAEVEPTIPCTLNSCLATWRLWDRRFWDAVLQALSNFYRAYLGVNVDSILDWFYYSSNTRFYKALLPNIPDARIPQSPSGLRQLYKVQRSWVRFLPGLFFSLPQKSLLFFLPQIFSLSSLPDIFPTRMTCHCYQ